MGGKRGRERRVGGGRLRKAGEVEGGLDNRDLLASGGHLKQGREGLQP